MKRLILADDFTGANDTGIQFAKNKISVDVVLDITKNYTGNADVVVFNTDSRAVSVEEAKRRVNQVLSIYKDVPIYKKIDSTLRGNIGAEIEASLDAINGSVAFICSALPEAGRSIQNGMCYVNNKPLIDTEFATDPKTPVISSNIKTIISAQTKLPVVEVMLSDLRQPIILAEKINQSILEHQKVIFSFDAVDTEDLKTIIHLANSIPQVLLIGSSGLAGVMSIEKTQLPMLFIVASMSEITNQQVNYIRDDEDYFMFDLDMKKLLSSESYHHLIVEQAVAQFKLGKHVIIKTDSSAEARNNIEELGYQLGLTRTELGDYICVKLSVLTKQLLVKQNYQLSAIFLTGGDIAIAVARVLGVDSYHIVGAVESGVPFGYFLNSLLSHISVVTKAGGFGTISVLKNTIEIIRNLI
ncbi:four-carbon acid sugar kinase family protein [Pasteurella bettyae]|uniref:YgbK domain protein n=1 Tax=Pasteurella bettyae CCUG 2042 TaxID=1095749 RepID=I3DG86_9PAST|nr:four-carbon acid sugar kinase family protein [Pasteurella bettyae]EIJ70729.1 YgbK domain protein [Pasteurella bettyae CCUG 2042]SUB22669.1 4-hydroxy-3-methylbut-2-enyl diphosphate reductase [Pasteurella bettyae]